MVLGVRSALPPAHSRTEGKQKATTPAPPQVASPQRFQRREALGSFLYRLLGTSLGLDHDSPESSSVDTTRLLKACMRNDAFVVLNQNLASVSDDPRNRV